MLHGRTGPFPIRHERYDELTSSLRGFIDATAAEGFPRVQDFNGPNPGGVGGYPVNVVDGVRQNIGLVYLTEEVRHRANLKISGDVLVDRVLFDGRRAIGVLTASGAEIRAGQVILSARHVRDSGDPDALGCGSGRGPGRAWHRGCRRSSRRAASSGSALLLQRVRAQDDKALGIRPAVGALLWTQSSEARGDELDIHIAVTHLMPPEYSPTGGAIALSVAVVKPDSRGTVALRSRDPHEQPEIDCNFLAEERDARRMLEGVRLARQIGRNPALAQFLELEILPGDAVGDEQLADAVASNLVSYGHPTATAPMGGPEDQWAVVDSLGAVKSVEGLRVVDASIIPVGSIGGDQSHDDDGRRADRAGGLFERARGKPSRGPGGADRVRGSERTDVLRSQQLGIRDARALSRSSRHRGSVRRTARPRPV